MRIRLIWAIPMTLFALAACLFIAGDIDVLRWSVEARFWLVFVAVATFVLTATCPLLEEF